jgi:hypothetical protein
MNAHPARVKHPLAVELGRRYFSLEQANRALVLVRRITGDILGDYQKVLDQQEILEVQQRGHEDDAARQTQGAIITLVDRLQSLADELVDVGAEMRDWAEGIIDFPHLAGGQEIQLCWRHGEPEILHWHYTDQACSARQKLEALPV